MDPVDRDLKNYQAQQERLTSLANQFDQDKLEAMARLGYELGSSIVLETISELGSMDPPFDEWIFTAYKAQDFDLLGRILCKWFDYYLANLADMETRKQPKYTGVDFAEIVSPITLEDIQNANR